MNFYLYNTISGKKEEFKPIDPKNVRMYVCGPTVYDRPHIGNARAVVVYDILFRILREIYGENHVTYARNITDVDDKINKAARENSETIQSLTSRITKLFHDDMAALNNLPPTHEPKATENIKNIIDLIKKIIDNKNAYVSEGHVLLDVSSIQVTEDYHYGILSGKIIWKNIAGARIEVESYKKNPEDFVLWKPADKDDDASSVFDSPWGKGRPGWHIECSAMSSSILGNDFDIHGGGTDLKFPHHENEIAQSKCANPESHYAKYWVHNGFVTVNGEKMSKSVGNVLTIKDFLDGGVQGETVRLFLLSAHYSKPLDFNDKLLEDAKKTLDKFYDALRTSEENKNIHVEIDKDIERSLNERCKLAYQQIVEALLDDMNTPLAISHLYTIAKSIRSINSDKENLTLFKKAANLLGICQLSPEEWFSYKKHYVMKLDSGNFTLTGGDVKFTHMPSEEYILQKIAERTEAKKNKNFALSDQIRNELAEKGVALKDNKDGTVEWNYI